MRGEFLVAQGTIILNIKMSNRLYHTICNYIILLLCMIIISGCTGDRCIDADDFGAIRFNVSSRYDNAIFDDQDHANQVAPWVDTGLITNSKPLALLVKTWEYGVETNHPSELSAWCPWYGDKGDDDKLSRFCERLHTCIFHNDQMCTETEAAQITNAPCLLKNGVGLYALMSPSQYDPNASMHAIRNPDGTTVHLGERNSIFFDVSSDGNVRSTGGAIVDTADGDKLFFKILDKFYDDNNGQYRVLIKSGVYDSRPDPIEYVTQLVKDRLFGSDHGLIRDVYLSITRNTYYQNAVYALLILYVIFSGLVYLTGNIAISNVEFISRLLKVIIISILLNSQYSWSFFNDYLFVWFTGGLEQILNILRNASANGPGGGSLVGLMIAPHTIVKVLSLAFVDWRGLIYIILFCIVLYFVILMVIKASIMYLSALIMIGAMIILAPVFLCFLLFDFTRPLFENLLKQLTSYTLQIIVLFAGIALISIMARSEIYASLGFRVCKYDFPNLGPLDQLLGSFTDEADSSLNHSIFYFWFPSPMRGQDFNKQQQYIPIPNGHFKNSYRYCDPYECKGYRYLDLPFLDPQKDSARINKFFQGQFVHFDGLLYLFLIAYLLNQFNAISSSISRFLSSATGNLTRIEKASTSAFKPVAHQMHRPISYAQHSVARSRVGRVISAIPSGFSTLAAVGYEKMMTSNLRSEAITRKANSLVLDEVKKKYGLNQHNVNLKAHKQYRLALENTIKQINPDLKKSDINHLASKFQKTDYKELKNEFAKLKFGADSKYESLKIDKKAQVDNLMKFRTDGKTLAEFANDAKYTKEFQEAYVEAHQSLSERGIGLLGKKSLSTGKHSLTRGVMAIPNLGISVFRSWKNLDNRVKENRRHKQEKRLLRGEKIYSGYASVKRSLLTKVLDSKTIDAIEGGLTGAAWHGFDYQDPRLRTYDEMLNDKKLDIQYQALQEEINNFTVRKNIDPLSPESFIQQTKQQNNSVNYHENLLRQQMAHQMRHALSEGEDPALMGAKFMREKATDKQIRHMIDRTYEVQKKLMNDDRYIRREDYYQAQQDAIIDDLQVNAKMLSQHFGRDDINSNNIGEFMRKYYEQQIDINQPEATQETKEHLINKELEAWQQKINTFDHNAKVLTEINSRKNFIIWMANKHVHDLGMLRKELKMPAYSKRNESINVKAHTLNDIITQSNMRKKARFESIENGIESFLRDNDIAKSGFESFGGDSQSRSIGVSIAEISRYVRIGTDDKRSARLKQTTLERYNLVLDRMREIYGQDKQQSFMKYVEDSISDNPAYEKVRHIHKQKM